MCNLDINQQSFDDSCLLETTTTCSKLPQTTIARINSNHLESTINDSRMIIMMDYVKNRPRKIILDTKFDNSTSSLNKNKETQSLAEIVFGNFNLSSKANGFKLHTIKNPTQMIVSKLFNTPFNSIYYDNRSSSRKVSPDSGNNQSSSSNSSQNSNKSCFSSFHSLNSAIINHQLPLNRHNKSIDRIANTLPAMNGPMKPPHRYHSALFYSSNANGLDKSSSGFFNDQVDIYQKTTIMMSIIFAFPLFEENRTEFEEFVFHYYVLLETILNRISLLISDNSYNIYNGNVVGCWKHSKKWLISLLPPPSITESLDPSSQNSYSNHTTISTSIMNFQSFEFVLEYFDKQKRLPFLAQILTAVFIANPNSSRKFFNKPKSDSTEVFPYKHVLHNIGVDIDNHTFNRIIVKGIVKDKFQDQISSWKDKFSSSFKYYKKILNNPSNDTKINLSKNYGSGGSHSKSHSDSLSEANKDVQILIEFISDLIKPFLTVAYQLHVLPLDSIIEDSRSIQLDDNKTVIEVPLINEGSLQSKTILPQTNDHFYRKKIINRVLSTITPLQSFIELQSYRSQENLFDQILIESQQSEITYDNKVFHPDFVVIDTDLSVVKIGNERIISSNWIEKLLIDIISLMKVTGYCTSIGEMFLNLALNEFSNKAKTIKKYISENQESKASSWIMAQHGLSDCDLPLILSLCN